MESIQTANSAEISKKIKKRERIKQNIPLVAMSLPAMIVLIMFSYVPMFGLILAFKDFSYRKGIWNSPWVGWKNFEYVFTSGEIGRTIGNTIGYHFLFTFSMLVCSLAIAILLYFIKSKKAANFYQKTFVAPYLISYVIISYIVFILLNSQYGLLNQLFKKFGWEQISWYTEPKYWPGIFTIVQLWLGAGIKSVYYYGSLMAIDQSLFEAADLAGANRWQKIRYIMLPSIAPTICIFMILDLGHILGSSFEMFYAVPMDSSALYSVTDVLATYTYRGLISANIGTTTALGLFTGVVTTVTTLTVNGIVKKISPENSLL